MDWQPCTFSSDTDADENFLIVTADGEWTGAEAETLEGARCAAETLADEGQYPLPLGIVPPDTDDVVLTLTSRHGGYSSWLTSDLLRRYEGRAVA